MRLDVAHDFLPRCSSVRASRVMDHFGIGFEQGRHVIAQNLDLPIGPGQVVLFTGPSGSGKSSLMREAARQLADAAPAPALADDSQPSQTSPVVLDIDALPTGDQLLIDSLPVDAIEAMQLLALCGLSEARLLLRRPTELSDGQRYRYRLALAVSRNPGWVLADEFTATLDRTLARVVAFNLRRLAERTGIGFLLATTHEDVIEDLSPAVHVRCGLDGTIDVRCAGSITDGPACAATGATRKKKASASSRTSGSAARPVATGRISLGGITAATSCR